MTLDTIMVVIAVTAMFATLAIVLGRADKQTNGQAKKGAEQRATAPVRGRFDAH